MDAGRNLGQSFDYAKKLFDNIGHLLILIIITVIPIVDFITIGYVMKIARETPDQDSPPRLANYGKLFIDGLKTVVVSIVYMIIPALLLGLGIASITLYQTLPLMFMGTAIIFTVLGLVLMFFICIIFFMALVNMAKYDSISKAFAFSEILGIIKKVGWGSYLLWIIVIFVITVIVGAIGNIPVIGWLLALILAPVFSTFVMRSAALVYMEGKTGAQPVTTQPAYPPPPPPPTSQQSSASNIFCSNCGAANPSATKFCFKCGKELVKG